MIRFKFLNYYFNIETGKKLENRIKHFWKGLLTDDYVSNENISWKFVFEAGDEYKTYINYKDRFIIHTSNSECLLTDFNNLLREIIVKITAKDGLLWLHSAAFEMNHKTILVIGEKNFGKTTILLEAILNHGAKFICNDQLPVFDYKSKLCTLFWRPDIKIKNNAAGNLKLTEVTEYDKIYMLVNNTIPYSFINFKEMSKRQQENLIQPDKNLNIKTNNKKINSIDIIIFLSKNQIIREINNKDKIWDEIKNDSETIVPYKLKNIDRYMSYWNKRIKRVPVSNEAQVRCDNIVENILEHIPMYEVGNRLDIINIFNFIKEITNE